MSAIASTVVDLASAEHPAPDISIVAQQTEVSTGGLRKWIEDNIVFTILVVIACVVLTGGLRGNLSKVFTVGGLTLVGLAFVGIATSESAAKGLGNWVLGLFGINA
ncbi:hypothetical protein RHA1_ro08691 (plasmid) [Rhodococcus jostii RHA1]|uniref:Transmembrane protein n=1 Tax=Rhodococcus jostii (strain RHA1) TaxID=101510 RepID=Q0RYA1_RHOJR|nr:MULTISPECIES: hypothetical protein [Rhodococcus]ABG99735.1 hypothetical protein RHA1_ro08691 [Rhodococcus jostii RHA1]QQZ18893.1 hypothetical protein GO592_35880 [Rhodococcus sp. 21391]